MQAAEWWGTAKTSFLFHARGIEHHSNGVQNSLGTINLVLASGRIGKPKSGYGTIVGQANGQGGREHGQKCDQLPGWRDISNPEHRRYIAGVWGIDEQELPGPGRRRLRAVPQDRSRRDQGPAVDLLQPEGLAAGQRVHHALPREAGVLRRDRLLPQRHRLARRHRAARQPAGGGRGHGHAGRGAHHQDQQGRRLPGRGARRTGASSRTSRRRSAGRTASRSASPREIFEELRVASKGGVADYSGITYEKIDAADGRVLAVLQRGSADRRADRRSSRHAAAVRARQLQPGREGQRARSTSPTARARFNVADYRPPVDDASDEYPIYLTTGRVVSQFLSGTQTRRIGPLVEAVPGAAHRDASAAGGEARDRGRRLDDGRDAARRPSRCKAQVVTTIRPDTIFIPYHWPGRKSANQLTVAAQDPISKIPQYKVCGCRVRKADGAAGLRGGARAAAIDGRPSHGQTRTTCTSSSIRTAASAARRACRRAPSATRIAASR